MPRPPRTKVASSTSRVTKPKPEPKQQAKTTTRQTRKATAAVESISDDSDGLITKSKSTRQRRQMPREKAQEFVDEAELTMTGALPAKEPTSAASNKDQTPISTASKRVRTARGGARALSTKPLSPAVASTPARSPIGGTQNEISIADDSTGFGDLTFSSLGSDSPAHGTRPPSAIKVGATPAHEQSILALTNFKRRARQPSLLRMVQQTTDMEDNDQDDLDNTDNFDFDDFIPHAESTPLNVRRNAVESEPRNDSGTQISSSGSRGTKRKLSPVIQVPRSSPPFSPPSGADVESRRSSSPSLPEVLPSREEIIQQTQDDPEVMSETFAPPLSSSPIREVSAVSRSPEQTRPRRRGRLAKTPVMDSESEAEETETPARSRRGAKKKAQSTISTAQLKGLLPRRRNRMRDRDEFDLDSSDQVEQIDSDQDELQMPERRSRQRTGAGNFASPKTVKKTGRGKKAGPTKAMQKASTTYSRRISSDKENNRTNQDDEESIEVSAIEHSEKLAAIKKKFEEVDAFELEFETVDVTTSSSPFR